MGVDERARLAGTCGAKPTVHGPMKGTDGAGRRRGCRQADSDVARALREPSEPPTTSHDSWST
jgi:hypothetical protein